MHLGSKISESRKRSSKAQSLCVKDCPLEYWVGKCVIEPVVPCLVEPRLLLYRIYQFKYRWQTYVERKFPEQTLGEAMDSPNERGIER